MYTVVVMPSAAPPSCGPPVLVAAEVDASASFQAGPVSGAGPFTYAWNFGDGTPTTTPSASPTATHAYDAAGRYPVVLTVSGANGTTACSAVQIVHEPLTPTQPDHSQPIVRDAGRVYCVNPDQNTASAIDADTHALLWEVPVGTHPRTLAVAPDGRVWVVNQDDATLSILDPTTGALSDTVVLPRASRPYGIVFRPDGAAAYVSLEAGTPQRGRCTQARRGVAGPPGALGLASTSRTATALVRLLELDPIDGTIRRRLPLAGKVRGLAVSGDSSRLFVTRFVTEHPRRRGLVWAFDTADLALLDRHLLAFDPGPDSEASGRGTPNYLTSLTISPDGTRLLVPGKKDNVARGLFRDGQPLTFESRVRTIVSQIDLEAGGEVLADRLDLNDRDLAQAIAFTPLGDLFAVAVQGTNVIDVFDARTGTQYTTIPTGAAPQGLVFAADGSKLFVKSFLDRSIDVFDTSAMVEGTSYAAPLLASVPTTAGEVLSAQVLEGKRIFHDASDRRMNLDGYLSCASCHLDGDADGQTWDVTQLGEGLRNTIPLLGRGGLAHGNVHWTANFDEIQDFENDMREGFGGAGFLLNADFLATEDPLGAPKAGLSPELDALAAYVSSLDTFPPSPYRNQDGSLSPDAVAGQQLFASLNCASCHPAPSYTDGLRHDVGTILPSSGLGIGLPLPGVGFETPTLLGLWDSAPYLHDGRAGRLEDVLGSAAHGGTHLLTDDERGQLARYLLELE